MAGIVWWEVETVDPDRFRQFHGTLFGWTFESAFADTELGADYWIIRHDGRDIGGLQRMLAAGTPVVGSRVYFLTDDLEATLTRAVALGGTVECARTELGGDDRWFGVFTDPTGVSFGLWTPNPRRTTSTASTA